MLTSLHSTFSCLQFAASDPYFARAELPTATEPYSVAGHLPTTFHPGSCFKSIVGDPLVFPHRSPATSMASSHRK